MSASGIGTDPEKISDVREWPIPTKLRELRSFIGFTSYYRRYVAGYSTIAKPLHDLVTECCAETEYNKELNLILGINGLMSVVMRLIN